MELQLIEGHFTSNEAIDLITQMIQVKIKYHEKKIKAFDNEEDIKMVESKIKFLQKELAEARSSIENFNRPIRISSQIKFV